MEEATKQLLLTLLIIVLLFSIYKIKLVRYSLVRLIWKAIDWISNKSAVKAVLPEGVMVESDLSYVNTGSPIQALDVYYPDMVNDKLPIIIFTHGGGFIAGDKKQTKQYCMTLAKEGYAVFNINYRLAPEHIITEQLYDVFSAMEWIKENCWKYNGDKDRIVLAGDSGGAYLTALAACISTNEELADILEIKKVFTENEIKGILLFSGLYDLRTGSKTGFPSIKSDIEMLLGADGIEADKNIDMFSVIRNINSKFPKAFISSGEMDWMHSESIQLINALDKNGVYHRDMLFDKPEKKAMHDYQFRLDLEPSQICLKGVIEFLRDVL